MSAVNVTTWVACAVGDSNAITKQSDAVGDLFVAFVAAATKTLDIAIYDFRLNAELGAKVMGALNAAAMRGVQVRVAYFQQAANQNTAADGGDPSPGTQPDDLKALSKRVAVKAIQGVDISDLPKKVKKEPIEGGGHLMHSKYMVRDGASVWTGSANFTTDAWSIQDNNVVELDSQQIAQCYETDFQELWANGRIAGTGKNDLGKASVDGQELDVAFSPGEGSTVEKEVAGAIQGASHSVAIASMVISSGAILGALIDALGRGVALSGVYDGSEMAMVLKDWGKSSKSAGKAQQWQQISAHLHPKWSLPYKPNSPHNFMHNKLAVVDDKLVVTGSFNFSENATKNAENLLTIREPAVVQHYAEFVSELVTAYKNSAPPGKSASSARRATATKRRTPTARAKRVGSRHRR